LTHGIYSVNNYNELESLKKTLSIKNCDRAISNYLNKKKETLINVLFIDDTLNEALELDYINHKEKTNTWKNCQNLSC
jgi:ssRNA-specific RNase YbeY (16S rRNA maturation enzyme)